MAKKDRRFKYQEGADRPVTISIRIPQDLYDRLERYHKQYNQSVSELVRDGIEMRLEVEADPRSRAGSTTDEPLEQIDGASILRDMRDMQATIAQHETQMHALRQAVEQRLGETESTQAPMVKVDKDEVLVRIQQMRDKGLDSTQITKSLQAEGVPTLSAEAQLQVVVDMLEHRAVEDCSEGNTSSTSPASMDTMPPVQATVLQPAQNPALASGEIPPFDTSRDYLGKLCPRGHDYHGTGQSLLRKHNQRCRECENESRREGRAKKRQDVSA